MLMTDKTNLIVFLRSLGYGLDRVIDDSKEGFYVRLRIQKLVFFL